MTITDFNYVGSYLPGVICNIVVKADLGRSTTPSELRIDDLNTATPNLADEPTLANGPLQWMKNRCLEYCYTKLGRWTYFGQWTPLVLQLVIQNGNFTLILTSSGQEWQLADLHLDLLADLPPKCIMGYILWDCVWQPFWIIQEKVGISFYFWIIRLVNSH